MSATIEKRALELLWKQWTAVGVAGVVAPPAQALDLEALIAFTPFLASADPRLAEESRDWCVRVGKRFISISRLRQIVRLMPPRPAHVGIDLPSMLLDPSDLHALRLSGKSRAPALDHPSLLQLRSRCIFGVGARADILASLAMRGRIVGAQRTSAIRPTGYSKQAVSLVLDDLAAAGVLRKLARATAVSYELVKEAPLRSLLSPLPLRMPGWAERFVIVASVLDAWRRFGTRASYAIELAKVLDGLRHVAAAIGQHPPITGRPADLLERIEAWASSLLDDEIWEASWLFDGEDISQEMLACFREGLTDAVHAGEYSVEDPDLDAFVYRIVDARTGIAEFRVQFTARHPTESYAFDGHLEGRFRFDPDPSDKAALLTSLRLSEAREHFDLGDPA